MTACTLHPELTVSKTSFDDLAGWRAADHDAALPVFMSTLGLASEAQGAGVLKDDWEALRRDASRARFADARSYFEALFTRVAISDGAPALFTGYFEPELEGSRTRDDRHNHPIHKRPQIFGQRGNGRKLLDQFDFVGRNVARRTTPNDPVHSPRAKRHGDEGPR